MTGKTNAIKLIIELYRRWALKYLKLILLTIGISMVLVPADRGRAAFLKPIIDSSMKEKNWGDFQKYALIIAGLSCIVAVLKFLKEYLSNFVIQKIILDLRNDIFEKIIYLPLSSFYSKKQGDLVSRVLNDVGAASNVLSFLFDDFLIQPLSMVVALALMFWVNWILGLAAITLFFLYIFPIQKIGKKIRKTRQKSLEHLSSLTQSMMQSTSGIKVVKTFNMESAQLREFDEANKNFFRKIISSVRKKALNGGVTDLGVGVAISLLVLLSGQLVINNNLTIGEMTVFAFAIAIMNTAVKDLVKGYNTLQESISGVERILEILDVGNVTCRDGLINLSYISSIEFKNVSFSYDTRPVLRNISFVAKPNGVIAIVGKSGSGKTTLMDLLLGFYEPTAGAILISNLPIKSYTNVSLLKHFAVVTQEPFLFNTTILENIKCGNRGASLDEVKEAAKIAYIHDFISSLKSGYETVVGERGVKLSTGEKQRICIARAILKKPSILILDEATSSLDSIAEKEVQAALDNLLFNKAIKNRFTFVIAHRLSTIRNADMIIVLDNNEIVEMGNHQQLIQKGGLYSSLYNLQNISKS